MSRKSTAGSDDGVSELGETLSIVKSLTNTARSSREKLLHTDYTTDDVYLILSSLGLGYSADSAGSKSADIKAKSITENVKSVELMDPRKMSTSTEKLSDMQIGRNVFEAVSNMISQGGEPLVGVVKTNFPMSTFLSEIQTKMEELEESIADTKASIIEPSQPKDDRMKLKHEVALETKEDELRDHFKSKFNARVHGGSLSKVSTRSQTVTNDDTIELWEDSSEKLEFDMSFQELSKVLTRSHKRDILDMYNRYDAQVEAKEEASALLAKHLTGMRRQQVLEIFASEIVKQCNIIVQKLKTALMAYSFIREKLVQNVMVNGESIVQPLLTENLSGIYSLLFQEYNKITLGAFCNYLMDLMSETSSLEECNQKPQDPLGRVDKHLKLWIDMNLQTYMTQDHLFTITLLRTYHPTSNIRRDGVRHVFEFARELETHKQLRKAPGEYANMPLYTELVRWIKDVHVKGMLFSSNNSRATKQVPSTTPSNTSSNMPSNKAPSLELAAAGVEGPGKSGASGKAGVSKRVPPPPTGPLAAGPYDAEVSRDRYLFNTDGFQYVAMKTPCEGCKAYPSQHQPRCFNHRCRKCKLFGHREEQCAQSVRDSSSANVSGTH